MLQFVVEEVTQHVADLLRQGVGGVGAGEVEGPPAQAGGQKANSEPNKGFCGGIFPVEGFRNFVEPDQRIYGAAKEKGDKQRKPDGQGNGDVCQDKAVRNCQAMLLMRISMSI